MEIIIEKNVPIPPKYPLRKKLNVDLNNLEVGDSFEIPIEQLKQSSAKAFVSKLRKLYPDFNLITRVNDKGTRVWRTQ